MLVPKKKNIVFLSAFIALFLLLFGTVSGSDATKPGPLVLVGNGGPMASVATGADGTVHVVYDGKYRSGPSIYKLGYEEIITTHKGKDFSNVKIFIDSHGNPHIVYQYGLVKEAEACYYVTRKNGQWILPERFAHKTEVSPTTARTTLPDVAADSNGNVLVCFWALGNQSAPGIAVYRWRDKNGNWSPYKGDLSTFHAATPKVAVHNNKFYLHYALDNFYKHLSGPVDPLGTFVHSDIHFNSVVIEKSFQNEGTDFTIASDGTIAAAGNFRNTPTGNGVGVWASDNSSGSFIPVIIAEYEGERGEEGHQQPDIVIDEATGDIYVVYMYDRTKKAYYHVKRKGRWSEKSALLSELDGVQGFFRKGPSMADIPGKGVVACVVNDDQVYLRTIGAPIPRRKVQNN